MAQSAIHTEQTFEAAIEQHLLTKGGYERGNPDTFDRHRALDCPTVLRFVQSTQPKEWQRLDNERAEFLHC